MNNPYHIAIEGCIGVGKTSLSKLLGERLDGKLILEEFEENPFLIDFYKDSSRFAFQTQLLSMCVAGLNVFWFYTTYSKQVKATDSTISVVEQAKLIAGVSLLCWTIVIICGRLITYFRPPYHWCWLC